MCIDASWPNATLSGYSQQLQQGNVSCHCFAKSETRANASLIWQTLPLAFIDLSQCSNAVHASWQEFLAMTCQTGGVQSAAEALAGVCMLASQYAWVTHCVR